MLSLNKHIKTKPKPTLNFKNCLYVYVCIIVNNSTAQHSSDSFPSDPPDNHHSSDDIYWVRGGVCLLKSIS